jgi:integrase/recombinase XerD
MLLSEAFNLYRRDVIIFRNQSAKTEAHHNQTCKNLILFTGDINIEDLSFDIIRTWKLDMEKRGRSPETVRGYLVKLRVVLAYIRISVNCLDPASIPLPKRSARIPGVLSPKEVQHLINSTNKVKNKAIISLLYSTGLRVSELCSLNIKDVENDYFPVIGKGGKSRLCFIDHRTRGFLRAYLLTRRDNDQALFIASQTCLRITPGTIQEIFKCARRKAGFDWPVHPHTMRHSFATNLMMNGCGLYTVSKLLGHSSLETTATYLHLVDKDLEAAHKKYHSVA